MSELVRHVAVLPDSGLVRRLAEPPGQDSVVLPAAWAGGTPSNSESGSAGELSAGINSSRTSP